MSIPRLAIQRPVGVAMLVVALVFLGALSASRLPVDLLPDIAYPKLVVYTSYPDVAPAEVERFVTEPVEQQVATVPGVERVESMTREGASLVVLRFAWGTDMDFAALNVREKIDALRDVLPERAARPVVLRTDPRSEPIMAISVAGDISLWDLKELAETVFRRRLEQIDGVAEAGVTGGLEREIQVDVDRTRMESYGITLQQIEAALQGANASAPSGTIRRGRYRYALRTIGELQSVSEIGSVLIAQQAPGSTRPDGRVLLRDVATVTDGFRERESLARYNGAEAVGLLIYKESGANTVRVAERVEEALDQLRAEYPDVMLEVASSQSGFVAEAIANLVQEMILGAILAFLVLVLFLRDVRYPIAISLAIPISVITTFALMHATGVSINIMSLGGLALGVGMLVDNSIVVIENIFRHRERGLGAPAAAAVGTQEVQRAITAATLTTIAVFGPIVYVEGVAGELFAALSFAVAFSLLASLFVALTLLPMMASRWEQDAGQPVAPTGLRARLAAPLHAFDRWFDRFALRYRGWLEAALEHRGRVVLTCLGLLLLTVPFAFTLDRSVLPDVDQGAFRARITLPRGTPLETTADVAAGLESIVREDEDVAAVFSRIGRQTAIAGVEEEESGLHTAVLDVRLVPGARTDRVIERLRPRLAALPAGSIAIETGQATALGALLGAGEADVAVRVRGNDLDAAIAYADQIHARISGLPELTNVRVGTELGQPELRIEIDRERAASWGLEPQRIAREIETYMRGTEATQFVDFDRRIPVVVRLPDEARRSLETLYTLSIDGIPVRELVRIQEGVGPVEIRRLDQGRYVPVFADVRDGGVDQAVREIRTASAGLTAPPETRIEIGGENEEMRRSFRHLALAFALAVILVYMILAAEFESFIHPFTVLLSIPFALIGAVLALWLADAGVNTISLIGVIILTGIVDNNAVVMLDLVTQLRGRGLPTRQALIEAAQARLRPILMTTLTTMLAILPMALAIGAGGALQAPLGIAVFGGLFSATALTLIALPVAYDLIEDLRTRMRGAPGSAAATAAPAHSATVQAEHAPAGRAASIAEPGDRGRMAAADEGGIA